VFGAEPPAPVSNRPPPFISGRSRASSRSLPTSESEKVGEVVAQHVAGDADRFQSGLEAHERGKARFGGRKDFNVETRGVMLRKIRLNLGDDLGVMRPLRIEPENGGRIAQAARLTASFTQSCTGASLSGRPPDVALFDLVLEQDWPVSSATRTVPLPGI